MNHSWVAGLFAVIASINLGTVDWTPVLVNGCYRQSGNQCRHTPPDAPATECFGTTTRVSVSTSATVRFSSGTSCRPIIARRKYRPSSASSGRSHGEDSTRASPRCAGDDERDVDKPTPLAT